MKLINDISAPIGTYCLDCLNNSHFRGGCKVGKRASDV